MTKKFKNTKQKLILEDLNTDVETYFSLKKPF